MRSASRSAPLIGSRSRVAAADESVLPRDPASEGPIAPSTIELDARALARGVDEDGGRARDLWWVMVRVLAQD